MEKAIIKKAQSSYSINPGLLIQAFIKTPFVSFNQIPFWIVKDRIFNFNEDVNQSLKLVFINDKSFSSFNPHIVFEALFRKKMYHFND